MADSVKLSGTYDSIEAYNILTDIEALEVTIQGYKTDAETAATNAGTSETNAGTSATNAGTSESNASTYAGNALASANAAAGSESAASASAGAASASATLASQWASKTGGVVADGEYSAKYYAQVAASSASDAAASEAVVNGALPLSGGTMTGTLTLSDGGTALSDATVGTVVTDEETNISVTNTAKSLASVNLAAGTWVVTGTIGYASIPAGRLFASLNTTTTIYADTDGTNVFYSNVANNWTIGLNVAKIFVLNSAATVHVIGFVNGGPITANRATITAVRIV